MAKQEQFTFRVTPEERARLEAEALALDRPLSWLIRQKLFNADNPISLTEVRPTSSDNLLGAPWPPSPHPDAKPGTVLTSSGPLTVTAMDTPSATSPDRRAKAEPLDVRNSSQKAQSARDELLRGMGGKKK